MAITQNGPVCAVVRVVQTSDVTWRLFVQLDRDGVVVWSMEQDVVLPVSAPAAWPAPSSVVLSPAAADHDQRNARIAEAMHAVDTAALALTRRASYGGIAVGSNLHLSTSRVQQRAERFATYLVVGAMVGLIASIPALLRSGEREVIARLPAPLDWAPQSSPSLPGALLLPATDAEIPADWAVPRSSMHASATTTTGTAKAAATQRHSHVSRPRHANAGRSLAASSSSVPRTSRATAPDPATKIASGNADGHVNAPPALTSTGALEVALERCAEGPIFGRTWCEHRARTEYCAGQSGRRPECPTYAGNDFRYISAN